LKPVTNIAVAIPTLNRPKALERCLYAILAGTVLPAEIIIVNQGSHDVAHPVISRFASQGTPIICCLQPRKGLSAARNLAARKASHPVIAFTDDDCVPDRNWLARIEETMRTYPAVDGVTGRILPLEAETVDGFEISVRTDDHRMEFHGKALPWQVGSGGNFAVKREWLLRVGGYDERLGTGSPGKAAEDTDLFYLLLRTGAVIRYEPEVVIYHERQSRERLLRSFSNYSFGIGAFVAKYLRRGDLYALYILGVWMFWQVWQMGKSMIHRNRLQLEGCLLSLRGCRHGLAYGFRLG
jgi:glycosyltransferase involved in cell wall biosynthesis